MNWRQFVTLLGGCRRHVSLCNRGGARRILRGRSRQLAREFLLDLRRSDGGGSCSNVIDCRPTQSRMVGGHYEVKVDGVWTLVPSDKINDVVAPDGGAHVCAPEQNDRNKGILFCVILPPQGRLG